MACGPVYEPIPEMTQHGSYIDLTYGEIKVELKFDDPETEPEQSADEIARIASIAINSLVDMGKKKGIAEYQRGEAMFPYIENLDIRVVEDYSNYIVFCRANTVACNKDEGFEVSNIYLLGGSSYSCRNDYTIGHEILHSLLRGINVSGNTEHTTPYIFAWNPEDNVDGWNEDTVQEMIRVNPATRCGYKD